MTSHRIIRTVAACAAGAALRRPVLRSIGLVGLLLAMVPVAAARAQVEEGLTRVQVDGLGSVHAQPEASLAAYARVMLDPIEVAFAPAWDPRPVGRALATRDRERIRADLASLLRTEFVKEIEARGRYQVVGEPGAGVLRIRAEIRDLHINAPDLPTVGRVDSYTLSVGEMTLVAELRDSVSGALLARVIDRRRDPERFQFERTTRVDNVAAARRAGRYWAQILHGQLDRARDLAGVARP